MIIKRNQVKTVENPPYELDCKHSIWYQNQRNLYISSGLADCFQ